MLFGPDPIDRMGGVRFWVCSVCGDAAHWGKGWRVYASLADEDAAEIPFVTCSDDCADSDRAKFLVACAESMGSRQRITGSYPERKLAEAIKRAEPLTRTR